MITVLETRDKGLVNSYLKKAPLSLAVVGFSRILAGYSSGGYTEPG